LADVAVKVTGVPAQTGPAGLTVIVTAGVWFGFTLTGIVLEAAVFIVRQVPPLILIVQETISLLANVEEVKLFVALL